MKPPLSYRRVRPGTDIFARDINTVIPMEPSDADVQYGYLIEDRIAVKRSGVRSGICAGAALTMPVLQPGAHGQQVDDCRAK